MPVRGPLRVAIGVLGSMGPRWAAYRAYRAVQLRLGGLQRRAPRRGWDEVRHPGAKLELDWFELNVAKPPASELNTLLAEAEAILAGRYRLFEGTEVDLGVLPDWHRNPLTGQRLPHEVHWSRLHEFDYGDIKAVWELGRMRFGFVLARAYAHTAEPRYAEGFWRLFEHWCGSNPPNTGVHWRCGQEASMRLIACTFAASVLRTAEATSSERKRLFARFALATAQRTAVHLGYALSQRNNHGISECVGLLTAAALLPEAEGAQRWRQRALRHLRSQLDELVYADGGFAQHSLIYQRLTLHLMTWSHWLLGCGAQRPPRWLTCALQRCRRLLSILADPNTGEAPIFGPDDGTQLLVLQASSYPDLRPALDAAAATLAHSDDQLGAAFVPLSEASAWFTVPRPAAGERGAGDEVPNAIAAHPVRSEREPDARALSSLPAVFGQAWHAPSAGLMHWRNQELSLLLRCPTEFIHRPSQLDMLGVALQCAGEHIVIDPGTYSYNAEGPLHAAFSSAAVHSAPQLRGQEPAERLSRFLFHPWPRGHGAFDRDAQRFTAAHDGYERFGVRMVREVAAVAASEFEVVDRIHCERTCRVDVHWLLADVDWLPAADAPTGASTEQVERVQSCGRFAARIGTHEVTLAWSASASAHSVSWVRAVPDSDQGWYAPRYLQLAAARSLRLCFEVTGLVVVRTRFRSVCLAQDMKGLSSSE